LAKTATGSAVSPAKIMYFNLRAFSLHMHGVVHKRAVFVRKRARIFFAACCRRSSLFVVGVADRQSSFIEMLTTETIDA